MPNIRCVSKPVEVVIQPAAGDPNAKGAKATASAKTETSEPAKAKPADANSLWISLTPHERTVRDLTKLAVLAGVRNLNQDAATAGEWEIRTADNRERVARIPHNWPVRKEQFLPDGKGVKGGWERTDRFKLNGEQLQRIGRLASGEYLLAWLVRGKRCSNVMRFKVDSKHDPTAQPKPPLLELEAIPTGPGAAPPVLVIRARRHANSDPAPMSSAVAYPTLNIDGRDTFVSGMKWAGPDRPLRVGEVYEYILDLRRWDWDPKRKKEVPPPRGDKPHVIYAVVGNQRSGKVVTGHAPRPGAAWDAVTAKLPAVTELAKAVSLSGSVVDLAGKVGGGYEVWLSSGERTMYRTKADEGSRYEFFRIPPGTYKLICSPPKMGQPELTIPGIVIRAGKRTERDISLEGRFILIGRVLDVEGKPVVNMTVDFGSGDQAGAGFMNTTKTDANGYYRHASPLGTIGYIGVDGGRIAGKMPVVTPGVNFVDLVAEGHRYRAKQIKPPADQPAAERRPGAPRP